MSTLPPAPSGASAGSSRQPQLYAAMIITYVIATIATGLRFWARKLMKTRLWLDDWIAAAALLHATGLLVSGLIWLDQGYGQHYEVLDKDFATKFSKNLFVGEILYALVICLVKFSILAFYWRLFGGSIRGPCYILGIITSCWGIAIILVDIFQCNPVSGAWNRNIRARCTVDNYSFFVGSAVPNILTDAVLLTLPVPYIWRLHRTRPQKMALAGIFLLGSFVTVISIVRLTTLVKVDLKSPDLDYNFAYVGIWTVTESNMAIVSACLPSLRPILSLVIYGTPSPSARGSKGYASGQALKRSHPSADGKNNRVPARESDSKHHFVALSNELHDFAGIEQSHTTVTAGQTAMYNKEDLEIGEGFSSAGSGISVRNDMNVEWTQR